MMPEWLNIFLRSFALIIILFFLTKIMRKKQFSQLNVFDYITGIVAGSIVAGTTTSTTNFERGLIALAVWFGVPILIDFLALKSKTVRDITQGKATVIIQDGKVLEDNMKKTTLTTDDLLKQLRTQNVFQVADVEFALLEPTGEISVLKKRAKQPLTAADLQVDVAPQKESQTVIMDGKIIYDNLARLNLSQKWLLTELQKLNVTLENVFLAQVDSSGQLYVDLYDDQIQLPEPTEKLLLLAMLKKAEADLALFALATENVQSKQLYETSSTKLQQVIRSVEPYLQK